MTKLRSSIAVYSLEFKQKVLKSILNGEMSAFGAQTYYKIGGSTTVYRWLSKKEEILGPNFTSIIETMGKENQNSESIQDMNSELSAVKRLLELEQIRSAGYLKMIRIAEDKHNVSIEKKFGAK